MPISPSRPVRPRRAHAARVGVFVAVTAVLLVGATGCTAAGNSSSAASSASAQASGPAGGSTLAELGLKHGPTTFWLPHATIATSAIDQPNVVTLTLDDGPAIERWLAAQLPRTGWVVDAHRGGSILFHTDSAQPLAWQGAWTCSTQLCALTLRQQAGAP